MPISPPRPCTYPGCNKLVTKGRCEAHKVKHHWNHTKTAEQRGYGKQWKKIRKVALRRDRNMCQVCMAQGRYTIATQVDHIIPKAKGGSDALTNLQSICTACHKKKTGSDAKG